MVTQKINIKNYKSNLGQKHKIKRIIWNIIWFIFAKPIPRRVFNPWKLFLLRCFGAKIHSTSIVYSSAKIYAPWMLEMAPYACIAEEVDCYNVDKVFIGEQSTVSQKSYLCTASHDIYDFKNSLITKPIIIMDQSWIAADAFIGPGVTIGTGAVIGARSAIFKDVEDWCVYGGNPGKFIKKRIINV
jgi:putative colanic acid biosynthesis acetyltransferase WcaF